MGPPSRSEEGGREEFIEGIGTRGDTPDGRDLLLLSWTGQQLVDGGKVGRE